MRSLSIVLLLAAVAVGFAAPGGAAVATLSPDALQSGQKATVRTVFSGEKIEEFEAEIVGVFHGGRAEGDMILARATSERVVQSGVAQGMSGSPVYVDGKLIGALSSGWSFSREPLFGVTPIGEMLGVLDRAAPGGVDATAGPTGIELAQSSPRVAFGEWRWDDDDAPAVVAPPPAAGDAGAGAPRPLMLPLACGGLNPAALEYARNLFAPFGLAAVPGGRAQTSAGADAFQPGSAVAVDLLRGDLNLSAIGTVTYRDGDRVLIFGHPLFQSGDVRLPMSTANITTIVASQLASFKLGVSGREVGMLTQDRRAGMAGRVGSAPHLLPVSVNVVNAGDKPQAFHFESIEDRALAPQIMALAALNSLLESGGIGSNQTVRWTLRMARHGAPALEMSDVIVGESPAAELMGAVSSPLRFLYGNPYERLVLDSVAIAVAAEPGRDFYTLRNAELVDAVARPGGRIRVVAEVERWRGGRQPMTLELAVPEELPDGRYTLWIGGGPELSRFESARLPGRYRPTSLDEAWRRLSDTRSSDRLYAALVARAPEVTRDGRDYPELPASAVPLLAGSQVAGDQSRRGDRVLLEETRVPVPGALRGELQIDLNVDRRGP